MRGARAGLVLIMAVVTAACQSPSRAAAPPQATEVKVEAVVQKDVPIQSEWVGTLVGYIDAQIRPRVSGYLVKQAYREGSVVKQGDVLFEIDPRPFQNTVDQTTAKLRQSESQVTQARSQVSASEAQVEQSKAVVAQAEADIQRAAANQKKTELDVARYTPLAERGSVSQQELDDAVQSNLANLAALAAARANLLNAQANLMRARAGLEKAQADVQHAQADVAAARAVLAEAKLNLDFTKVIAPISGIAGFRVANIGDLVGPSDTNPLTTVSQVDPMYVQFPVSEQIALRVYRRWQADPNAPRTLALELVLADGSVYDKPGKAEILERQVDVTTGTVLARGVFPNPGNVLRPGQYAKIRAVTEVKKDALLVSQRAVVDQQGLRLVAVVDDKDTVSLRPIKVGERVGPLWIVNEGLKRGERVVAEGAERVKTGEKVKPVPAG
jgi:membrane fusion protein, multidrug efflux system